MKQARTALVICGLLLALALAPWLGVALGASPGKNWLTNGGFEGDFRQVDNIGELTVGEYWMPWWNHEDTRPEFNAATYSIDPRRIREGQAAQHWFNTFSKSTSGIYQRIGGVPTGNVATFGCWVQVFSSNKDNFDESNGRLRVRIGIDPYGGVDPDSRDIVWSNDGHAIQPYDKYEYLEVATLTKSDRLTVWVWSQSEWPLKHNDVYVDACSLGLGGVVPTPTPGPTPSNGFTEEDIREFARQEIDLMLLRARGQ